MLMPMILCNLRHLNVLFVSFRKLSPLGLMLFHLMISGYFSLPVLTVHLCVPTQRKHSRGTFCSGCEVQNICPRIEWVIMRATNVPCGGAFECLHLY